MHIDGAFQWGGRGLECILSSIGTHDRGSSGAPSSSSSVFFAAPPAAAATLALFSRRMGTLRWLGGNHRRSGDDGSWEAA